MSNKDNSGMGPGKYDAVCTVARGMSDAKAAIVIIFDGINGSGFSVQSEDCMVTKIPELLEKLATDIREINQKSAH